MDGQTFVLTAELDSRERADKYLHELFQGDEEIPPLSRSQIQRLIDEGRIRVDGRAIRPKDSIPFRAQIELHLPKPVEISVEPEDIPLQILYDDPHLVVVNKQPGLTVHPSETQKSGTLVNALLHHIRDLSGIGGKLRPGIVHRIDKDTSGALVVSKTDAAHAGLSRLFSSHNLDRKYWALCYGAPTWSSPLTFSSTLGRSPADRKKIAVNVSGGRLATSHFELQKTFKIQGKSAFSSLIEARLETGRTHQVRVHLTHLGHSLLGDPVYGTPTSNQPKWKSLPRSVQESVSALPGQALHARELGFIHPITGKKLSFIAEPFTDFQRLLNELNSFQE
jgi:23S rRNA pseudouridine1911/1915/1917 synthase